MDNDDQDSEEDVGSYNESLEHEANTKKVQKTRNPCEQSIPKKKRSTQESKLEYSGHNETTSRFSFNQSGCSAYADTDIKTMIKKESPSNVFCGQRPLFLNNLLERGIKIDTDEFPYDSQVNNQKSRLSGDIKFEDKLTQGRPSVITRANPVRNMRQTSPISTPLNMGFEQRFLKWETQMLKMHGGLLRQTGKLFFFTL